MMAIPVTLDGDEEKYGKKTSIHRTRARSVLRAVLLPTAATVSTDVWFQSAILSSAFGYDLVLAITNVSGAFFDGFFSSWESGSAASGGAMTEALHLMADDMRAFYLSTYTSWAGMVSVAASLAHAKSSILIGIMYILLSIICAFIAHGLGNDFARYISSPHSTTNKKFVTQARRLMRNFAMGLVAYVFLSYIYLGAENIEDTVEDGNSFSVFPTPRNQLAISALFAIMGAYTGHMLSSAISKSMRYSLVPMETLVCNAFFGLLSLSLNIMKLKDQSWGDSLILRGFAINFCGAASLFARHASDNRRLYTKKGTGLQQAVINMTANVIFASVVFWFAFEIEELLDPGEVRRGVMVKLMKILEKHRAKHQDKVQ